MTQARGMPLKITERRRRPACPLNPDKTIIRRMYEPVQQNRRKAGTCVRYQLVFRDQDSLRVRTLEAKLIFVVTFPRFFYKGSAFYPAQQKLARFIFAHIQGGIGQHGGRFALLTHILKKRSLFWSNNSDNNLFVSDRINSLMTGSSESARV